ncbi:MAG: putative amidoligase enzyme [Pelotomaculum sp. PtaU1.Bin065]|nr:MAG: putative amidoligase enzyme [Pelotomaculum sp. PtaU1.Bin065]
MPVLREDVISRLRRLTALNRNRQRAIQDANQLTEGPFEVQADNGTVMQVEPWWSSSPDMEFEDAGSTFSVSAGACTCPEFQETGTCAHLRAAELLTTGSNSQDPGHVIETLPSAPPPLSGELRVNRTLRYRISTDTGNTYTVANGRCDCPDFINTGACVHVQAAELVQTGDTGPEPEETVTINAGTTEAPTEDNTRERELDLQRRRRRNRLEIWQERHEDGVWLSRDDDAFKQLYTAVRTGRSLEYEYEDVLAGSENSFGIEIEFVGGDLNDIARALGEAGLGTGFDSGYHSRRQPGKWAVERDGSVTNGNRGGEVISPVLKDSRETWEQLEKVCQIIKDHGGKINSKCGGHYDKKNVMLSYSTFSAVWHALTLMVD